MAEDVRETHRKAIKALQTAVAQLGGDDAQKELKAEPQCKIQMHKDAGHCDYQGVDVGRV